LIKIHISNRSYNSLSHWVMKRIGIGVRSGLLAGISIFPSGRAHSILIILLFKKAVQIPKISFLLCDKN